MYDIYINQTKFKQMKKLLLSIAFTFMSLLSFACHESYVTLVSGPTDIGGGQYSTTVQVCIGQTVNWGGTNDFTVTLVGANFVSYAPASLSNTYNAYTTASCGGPNCFMGTCASITANANSTSTTNVVTYTTSSSTPAGYPLVPDDVEQCGGNPTSYCFNFTFISDAYPTSISLGGNTEITRTVICQSVCGHPATYTSPCNGTYDPAMTLTFSTPLPIELVGFYVIQLDNKNIVTWTTFSEINNDFFTIERSVGGQYWDVIDFIEGAGTSSVIIDYRYYDYNPLNGVSYYRLKQTDYDGQYKYSDIVSTNRKVKEVTLVRMVNTMGQVIDESYDGLKIYIWSDGTTTKKMVIK
jgi:hypothetical protein